MKQEVISLNKEFSIDIERLIQGRLAILANSGGGKSWAIRRIAEQAAGKIQTIILDPEGEFSTLREKHDFILCGKGQDVPVEIRSAAKLAEMLLEARASAVIDLYELLPRDRKAFVRIFCETMVNAPKNLHHPVIVILDEAHDYVPEGKPSEATDAVESLASKGRKRDYALVLVSQRISKISKDALSECSNVMIGKATWAIDRKRAAEELGLTDKEEILNLKKMKPGEFYAIGPAISEDLARIQVGEVNTTHGKTSYGEVKPIPPSDSLKKALAKLAELPAEIEKEAKTSVELKEQLRAARQKIAQLESQGGGYSKTELKTAVDRELQPHLTALASEREAWKQLIVRWKEYVIENNSSLSVHAAGLIAITKNPFPAEKPAGSYSGKVPVIKFENTPTLGAKIERVVVEPSDPSVEAEISGPERKILNAIALFSSIGIDTPEQVGVAFLAGYTYGGGAFNNPRGGLRTKGLVEYAGSGIKLTEKGWAYTQQPDTSLTNEELHSKVLGIIGGPERRILESLIAAYPDAIENEKLAEISGYAIGGAFNNPKGRLRSLGLIEYLPNKMVRARDNLFPV